MEWLVVKRAWRGAAGLVAWRRLFFVALAGWSWLVRVSWSTACQS